MSSPELLSRLLINYSTTFYKFFLYSDLFNGLNDKVTASLVFAMYT